MAPTKQPTMANPEIPSPTIHAKAVLVLLSNGGSDEAEEVDALIRVLSFLTSSEPGPGTKTRSEVPVGGLRDIKG
jgi:hypothetical protein